MLLDRADLETRLQDRSDCGLTCVIAVMFTSPVCLTVPYWSGCDLLDDGAHRTEGEVQQSTADSIQLFVSQFTHCLHSLISLRSRYAK